MKIAVISHGFDCSGWAYLLKNEGNSVYIWVEKNIRALENIANIRVFHSEEISLQDFVQKHQKVGLIIFDASEYGAMQENLRKEGLKILGSSRLGEAIEKNRVLGYEIAKRLNINIPQFWTFKTIDEAISFLAQNSGKYVLKQSGNLPKNFNFIGQSDEIIDHLLGFQKRCKNLIKSNKIRIDRFVLQEYIEGVEVATAAFFTPNGWLRTTNDKILLEVNFEHKKLCPFDIGPTTGEMGTVAYFVEGENRIFQEMLKPLEFLLASYSNWGVVDANCIITEDEKIYLLEHTIRFGYPITDLYKILCQKQLGLNLTQFFLSIANGTRVPYEGEGFGITYVVAYPNFPYEDAKNKVESYLFEYISFPNDNDIIIAPGFLSREGNKWYISDVFGYAYTINVWGKTLESAMRMGREALERIHPKSGAFYRPDIGERVLKALKEEFVLRAITAL